MGHWWAPHLPRKQMPVLRLGCNLPPQTKQPLPEEVFLLPPDCGLSGSGQQWGSQLGQYHHSVVARTPLIGHENVTRTCGGTQGGELCDKRSWAQFTLADELQPCVHEAQAHTQRETRKEGPHSLCQEKHGGSSPSCCKCAKGHLSDCLPGFCWPHRKSELQRVLLLRSPKADRYKCPRSKSTGD